MLKKGIFGGLFDFNGDGELDIVERATELAALEELTSEQEDSDDDEFEDIDDDDSDDDEFEDIDDDDSDDDEFEDIDDDDSDSDSDDFDF